MTVLEGDELQRLWSLVAELSSQLSSNRDQCLALQQQADELKGQALHAGTGYTLRRFNLDISKEKFDSGLERINAGLVLENQSLAHENRQLNLLLREYEQTLEGVMSRFRSFSHATQQHTLQLTQHYESLLAQRVEEEERQSLHESTATSVQLSQLGDLVRLALRSLEGEDVPEPGSSASPTNDAKAYGSAPSADPRWYGTGGYTGPAGDPDAVASAQALAFATEEARLRFENEQLRLLLSVATEPLQPTPPQPPPTIAQLSLGKPRIGKKAAAAAAAAEAAALEAEEALVAKNSEENLEGNIEAHTHAESALDDTEASSEDSASSSEQPGVSASTPSYAQPNQSSPEALTTSSLFPSSALSSALPLEAEAPLVSSLLLSPTPEARADVEEGSAAAEADFESSGSSSSSGSDSGESTSSAATSDDSPLTVVSSAAAATDARDEHEEMQTEQSEESGLGLHFAKHPHSLLSASQTQTHTTDAHVKASELGEQTGADEKTVLPQAVDEEEEEEL